MSLRTKLLRLMMMTALMLLSIITVAAVTGPNGANINRAILPLGGALDVNRAGDCMPEPYTHWDSSVAFSGHADSTRELSLVTTGSSPSTYDLFAATALNAPKSRTSSNCNGAPYSCLEFDRAGDYLTMAANLSESWTKNIQCVAAYFPGIATDYIYTIKDNSSFLVHYSGVGLRYSNDGFSLGATFANPSAGWHAICSDLTTTNGPVSVDGVKVLTSGVTTTVQSAPVRVTLGNYNSGNSGSAIGLQIGEILFYKDDPGKSMAELSACLASKWSI